MDRPLEELQELSMAQVLRESISIPRASPRTFSLITLSLIFPLSFAILAHSLFTHPILHRLQSPSETPTRRHEWSLFFLYQFIYLLFLFTFSLLATAAVVFTVASIFAAKPVSFSATISAIPPVFSRLFRTFLCIALLMFVYNFFFIASILLLLFITGDNLSNPSVITVLEPVCGFSAMKKSRELLQGRGKMAMGFVLGYLLACGLISGVFRGVIVRAGEDDGVPMSPSAKLLIGGGLVAVLVVVNLVGLLVQSVFYYVCKSFHHEKIDRAALYEHLGVYLGEYVPLKSSIQMENFEL